MSIMILYPADNLPISNATQTTQIDHFDSVFELAVQVEKKIISMAELWKQDLPDGENDADIAQYLERYFSPRLWAAIPNHIQASIY